MADLATILKDPNYINANAATKAAIFEKYSAVDTNYTGANAATQSAIRQKFGIEDVQAAPEPEAEEPMGLMEMAGSAVKNIPSSAGELVKGVYQAVRHPVDTGGGLLKAGYGAAIGAMKKAVGERGFATTERILDAVYKPLVGENATQQVIDAANAVGGLYKERYGSAEGLKRTIAEDPVGVMADLSVFLQGAKVPQLAKATNPVNALTQAAKLPGVNALVKAPGKAVEGLKSYGRKVIDPRSAALMESAQGRAPQIVKELRGKTEIVPGVVPTAGEAAVKAQVPTFASYAEKAKTGTRQAYARSKSNKAAVEASIAKVAGTEEKLSKAQQLRSTLGTKEYEKAFSAKPLKADVELNTILDRPLSKKALVRAEDLAKNADISVKVGEKYTVEGLHYMKLAMDDLVKDPKTFGIGTTEQAQVGRTRKALVSWLEDKVPEYKVAREGYAERSIPINRMQIGKELEKALTTSLNTGQDLRSTLFANAIREAPKTLKKATGNTRYKSLDQVLTPAEMKIVNGVKKELVRSDEYKKMLSAAKGRAPDPRAAASSLGGAHAIPHLLSRVTSIANFAISRLQGKMDPKLARLAAIEIMFPKATAKTLEKALRAEALRLAKQKKPNALTSDKVLAAGVIGNAMAQE